MSHLTRPSTALASAALLFVASAHAHAQAPVDDLRVRQLETEILRLQREVDAQSRRIATLEQAARISAPAAPMAPAVRADSSPAWLIAASWDRIKPAMSAQETMAILGRPTSTRVGEDGKLRLLYYAMELGPDRVLVGTIRLENSRVVEINRPALK